ncbi:hypothetical protein [Streptomyces sp. NPDC001851]|uniref:hypothetical protein n=1 Tax=Streptomyces sp. NPDC001851 TaxID=3154529 RepID=UPI003329BFFB
MDLPPGVTAGAGEVDDLPDQSTPLPCASVTWRTTAGRTGAFDPGTSAVGGGPVVGPESSGPRIRAGSLTVPAVLAPARAAAGRRYAFPPRRDPLAPAAEALTEPVP